MKRSASLKAMLLWEGRWEIEHIRNGKRIFHEIIKNEIAQLGELNILDTYFRNQNVPAGFYLRLCYDTLVYTDGLANINNEPSGSGYLPVALAKNTTDFPLVEIDLGNYRVVSTIASFTASGGTIGPVNTTYLATSSDNTGLLIAYASLSQERILYDGDILKVRIRIKLKNA